MIKIGRKSCKIISRWFWYVWFGRGGVLGDVDYLKEWNGFGEWEKNRVLYIIWGFFGIFGVNVE